MSRTVLGLNTGEINSSACIVRGGTLLAGCPEERFNRQKLTKAFPHKAVDYCLGAAGLGLDQVDAIAQGWHPGAGWEKFNPLLSSNRTSREAYFYSTPDNLFQHSSRRIGDWVKLDGDGMPPVYFVRHHRCHAANAFFLSPFEQAAILTCDFQGESECTTFSVGRGNRIELLDSQRIPQSLGMFYAAITQLLGYKPDSDEWKVMALSAMDGGTDGRRLLDRLRSSYRLLDEGRLEIDQTLFQGFLHVEPYLYTDKLVELLGGRVGVPGETAGDWHFAVAYAMQAAAEEIAVHFLQYLHARSKQDALAVGGGFFMNSVFNGKILDKTPFKRLYVPYAPTDAGNSIGAALYVAHHVSDEPRDFGPKPSQIGPAFDSSAAKAALERRRVAYRELAKPAQETAQLLASGRVVAIMDGRAEFGDRALGHRSILGDPRDAGIKDRINSAIKYRESYRPFAPATLVERVADVFDVSPDFTCHYMEKVVQVRDSWKARLPSVTHADGSGRVQTVARSVSPHFHDLINEFEKITGVPVVLNTSFNVNGEPIVLSPDDAISTFFNSGLECLVLGNLLLEKP